MGLLDVVRLRLAECKIELVKKERLLLIEQSLLAEQERIKQERLTEQRRIKQELLAEQERMEQEQKYWAGMTVLEDETKVLAGEGEVARYVLAGSTEGQMATFERWEKDSSGRMYKYREFQRPSPTLIVDVMAGTAFDVRTCTVRADHTLLKPEQLRRILEAGGWPSRGGNDSSLLETDIIGADPDSVRLVD